jgi:hypothetical protein
MSRNNDPLGYYAILEVDPSASVDHVKRAYKAKAQKLHPDKNSSANATFDFQRLNEAYQVLGNPDSRSEYDARAYVLEDQEPERGPRVFQPIACCVCGKISVQPRYVIYRQVISFLFATYRSGCQGVFCAKCGATRAYRTSGITWLLGWWGIPWGPIYSVHAIVRNMLGEQPAITNFRVLAMQAAHFAAKDQMDIARLLADQALEFVPKIPAFCSNQESSADHGLRSLLTTIRDSTPAPARRLKPSWGVKSLPFRIQALAASFVCLLLSVFWISGASHAATAYHHVPPGETFDRVDSSSAVMGGPQFASTNVEANTKANQDSADAATSVAQSRTNESALFNESRRPLPPSGRMHISRKRSHDATGPLNIVTYRDSPNYYLKLVDLNTQTPVLFLFIRSGESVSTEVPLGRYELRLADGGNWYGEEYLFGPTTSYSKADAELTFEREGGKIAGYTLQLEKQVDGNLRETQIAPADF